jgi:hypothetical protein
MSSACFEPEALSSGRRWHVSMLHHNALLTAVLLKKHAEDIVKIRISVKQRRILLVYVTRPYYSAHYMHSTVHITCTLQCTLHAHYGAHYMHITVHITVHGAKNMNNVIIIVVGKPEGK